MLFCFTAVSGSKLLVGGFASDSWRQGIVDRFMTLSCYPWPLCGIWLFGLFQHQSDQILNCLIRSDTLQLVCFTHAQGNLGVYDFLLSDESNRSYIKTCPCSSKLYNGMSGCFCSTVQK